MLYFASKISFCRVFVILILIKKNYMLHFGYQKTDSDWTAYIWTRLDQIFFFKNNHQNCMQILFWMRRLLTSKLIQITLRALAVYVHHTFHLLVHTVCAKPPSSLVTATIIVSGQIWEVEVPIELGRIRERERERELQWRWEKKEIAVEVRRENA